MKKLLLIIPIFFLTFSCIDDIVNPNNTISRDDYLGSWNVEESCSKENYNVQIVAHPSDTNKVYINNFGLIGYGQDPPYAIIDEELITIPFQNVSGLDINGSGTMGNNKITWSYTIFNGYNQVNCSAIYTK